MKKLAIILIATLCGQGSVQAQQNNADPSLASFKYTVEEATDWTNLLKRRSGWFGGDGIYTIPLNGKEHQSPNSKSKTLFIFSDSMVGEVTSDTSLAPGYKMIHNSVAILEGDKPDPARFVPYWAKNSEGKPESVFIPKTPQTEAKDYYWFGDGFTNPENSTTYLIGYRVRNVSTAAFGFKEVGNTLLKIKTDGTFPFKSVEQKDTPFYIEMGDEIGSFGTGIFVNTKQAGAPKPDGYVYVYGVKGKTKNLMVARVLPNDLETFNKWTFWNGTSWSNKMDDAATLADWVSNEISVSAMPDGRYIMIFQVAGISTTIGARIGKTPYGPFGPTINLWDCSKALTKKTYLVYNAKGHPSISKPGELMITYNVNSVEFDKDITKDPLLYRPRFIRLKFNNKISHGAN